MERTIFGGQIVEDLKWLLKKHGVWFVIIFVVIVASALICGRWLDKKQAEEVLEPLPEIESKKSAKTEDVYEKGYDLPLDEGEDAEAKQETKAMMDKIYEVYKECDKGNASNVIVSEQTIREMVGILGKTSFPVLYDNGYDTMYNYQEVETFLNNAIAGKQGEVIIYEVHNDGGIGRNKFSFDGREMYVFYTGYSWTEDCRPVSFGSTYTRIKEWSYTDKGWFCYEYCVPEPPEVTELVDGNCMIRVEPMDEKRREIAEKYLFPLGYQGNNLLCSNWNKEHMGDIDYNGLFEYLYSVEYQERFDSDKYENGIPKDEFERIMTDYLPVTNEQLQTYAVYDEQSRTYVWNRLGCMNYAPNSFGLSMPEITSIEEKENGVLVLTVDAVCERVGSDCVMSHELTVQVKDGKMKYISNQVLGEGLKNIPAYQYRLRRTQNEKSS